MKFTEEELEKIKKERMEQIDKWLDSEYGCSYTHLEELHDFVIEQDMKHQEEKDKEIERLNKCYCNRSDCGGRLNQKNEVYDSVVQRNEKAIEYIEKDLSNLNIQENIVAKNELLQIKKILKGEDK